MFTFRRTASLFLSLLGIEYLLPIMDNSSKTRIVYIENADDFHRPFLNLRESARGHTTPDHFLVGFDTEYVEGNPKKVCVIQMGTADLVLVIHVSRWGNYIPKQLLQAIQSPAWIKVGVGVGLDLHYISVQYKLGHCSGGIDLRNMALTMRLPHTSLVGLYNHFLKPMPQLPEKAQSSVHNWNLPGALPKQKVEYAGKDAYMGYAIFKAMLAPVIQVHSPTQKRTGSSSINLLDEDEEDNVKGNPQVPETTKLLLDLTPPSSVISPTFVDHVEPILFPQPSPMSVMDTEVYAPPLRIINYVGRLNEYAQQQHVAPPKYAFGSTFAGEHTCLCTFCNGSAQGIARSKKLAKQQASNLMLKRVYDGNISTAPTPTPTPISSVKRLELHAKRTGRLMPLYSAAKDQFDQYKVACAFDYRHDFGYGVTEEAGKEAAAQKMLMALSQGK
jgi:hypothetical protein